MRIILKNIIRNILSNKRRTLVLILCMTAVAFSAMSCFSIAGSAEVTLHNTVRQYFGDSCFAATNFYSIRKDIVLPEGTEAFYTAKASIDIQKRSADNFVYPTKFSYSVIGMDVGRGAKKSFLPYDGELSLGENEIIVTALMAQAEELSAGSTIDILDADKNPLTLTVKYVLPSEGFLKSRGACAVSTIGLAQRISGDHGLWNACYISMEDESRADEAYELICESNPDFTFDNMVYSDAFFEIYIMFFGIFLVLALIIFTVTSGISEHIIRERMSQLGTLRSLGATKSSAALALIAENLFYGLIGAVVGILLYIPAHKPLIDGLVSPAPGTENDYSIKAYAVLLVLLITSLLACGSAVKAVLKAVKTPIRDIIFGSRDSAYVLKKPRCIVGIVLMLAGLAGGLFVWDGVVILISISAFTVGLILFVPLLLDIIKNIMKKCPKPVVRFSFINIATKKTCVDSTVLYSAVIGLVSAVLMIVCYIGNTFSELNYSGDIILENYSMSEENYRFIAALDEVERSELFYSREEYAEINGVPEKTEITVIGYGGRLSLYNGVKGLPESIAENEVSLDEIAMKRLGIREGDSVNVTLNARGERPVKLTLTAVKGCNTNTETFGSRNGIVISLDMYKKLFFDYPHAQAVVLKDPAAAPAVKQKISTYLMDKSAQVSLYDEYEAYEGTGNDNVYFMLAAIVGIGCLMSVILLVTNQSVGFEQRKKELAVLHSTSMSRAQLKKMLFCETALSILIATAIAFASGIAEYIMMMNFVGAVSGSSEPVIIAVPELTALFIGMYLLALLTTVGNGKRIKKMNTAEQMKYE